jgi:hypothetical protein
MKYIYYFFVFLGLCGFSYSAKDQYRLFNFHNESTFTFKDKDGAVAQCVGLIPEPRKDFSRVFKFTPDISSIDCFWITENDETCQLEITFFPGKKPIIKQSQSCLFLVKATQSGQSIFRILIGNA